MRISGQVTEPRYGFGLGTSLILKGFVVSHRRTVLAIGLSGFLGFCMLLDAAPQEGNWKAVDEAIQKGLPKTAIENLDRIIPKALEDQKYAEAIKAIGLNDDDN